MTLTEPLWYYATGLSAPILAGVEECSLNKNQTAILGSTLVDPSYSLSERQPLIDKFQNATSKLEDIADDFVYYYSKLLSMQNQSSQCFDLLKNATAFSILSA